MQRETDNPEWHTRKEQETWQGNNIQRSPESTKKISASLGEHGFGGRKGLSTPAVGISARSHQSKISTLVVLLRQKGI